MTSPTKLEAWSQLEEYQRQLAGQRIESLFEQEPGRYEHFSLSAAGLTLDYSKNLLDETGLQLLLKLAQQAKLPQAIEQLFRGDFVNRNEQRPALHTALRNKGQDLSREQRQQIEACHDRMSQLVADLHQQAWRGAGGEAITDVINIGIGGSDLGPSMACLALHPYDQRKLRIHFVSNLDGTHITEQIEDLDPRTTLFIISSKSFTTLETMKNADSARQWLLESGIEREKLEHHFIAVTNNKPAAVGFGVASSNVLPLWDWVGGRYSIWSAVGLSIALQIGMDNFDQFLAGGADMDRHFRTTEFRYNMPVILALLSTWYTNFFKSEAQIVVPYDHSLNKFPIFLQQLEMESNGKSVQQDGTPVDYPTMGAIFGEAGSNTQHSFHQLLLQGTRLFPVDFIIPARTHYPVSDHHTLLLANCIAQSRALMTGRSLEQIKRDMQQAGDDAGTIERLAPHKVIEGNKPSNLLSMEMLTPAALGALIALYEHKVYVQSVIWNINAFDQWGVELGKQLSADIYHSLAEGEPHHFDESTNALIDFFRKFYR